MIGLTKNTITRESAADWAWPSWVSRPYGQNAYATWDGFWEFQKDYGGIWRVAKEPEWLADARAAGNSFPYYLGHGRWIETLKAARAALAEAYGTLAEKLNLSSAETAYSVLAASDDPNAMVRDALFGPEPEVVSSTPLNSELLVGPEGDEVRIETTHFVYSNDSERWVVAQHCRAGDLEDFEIEFPDSQQADRVVSDLLEQFERDGFLPPGVSPRFHGLDYLDPDEEPIEDVVRRLRLTPEVVERFELLEDEMPPTPEPSERFAMLELD